MSRKEYGGHFSQLVGYGFKATSHVRSLSINASRFDWIRCVCVAPMMFSAAYQPPCTNRKYDFVTPV